MMICGARPARADELPEGACAARLPFDAIGELIAEEIQESINGAAADATDLSDLPGDATMIIHYGGASFSVVDLSGDEPQDPNSSNDDLIDVDLAIDWTFAWHFPPLFNIAASGTIHVHLRIMFPQDAPPRVDPEGGYTCKVAERQSDEMVFELLGVLERCDDQTEPIEGCGEHPFRYTITPNMTWWDASFFYDPAHPERERWLLAGRGLGMISHQDYPVLGCEYADLLPCDMVFRLRHLAAAANHSGSLCLSCARPAFTLRDVHVPATNFPGIWAVDVTYDHVPDFPGINIETRVRHALQRQGIYDVTIAGQSISGACGLQERLAGALDPLLDSQLDESFELTIRDLIRQSGGVRISPTTRSVDLLIPPVQPLADDNHCTERTVYYDGLEPGSEAELLSVSMDLPKVAQIVLNADPEARRLGLYVTCDQGMGCPEGQDRDHDGFCDDDDHCPDTLTGVNCDQDDDGFGDGHWSIWALCGPLDPGHAPQHVRQSEAFLRARHFYCGGCDNCQGTPNPDVVPEWVAPEWLSAFYPGQSMEGQPQPARLPTRQLDLDRDWLGDVCDPDTDGDGVANDFDCLPRNGCLGRDLDQDGVCEAYSTYANTNQVCDQQACLVQCYLEAVNYYGDNPTLGACLRQCADYSEEFAWQRFDNCAPPTTAADPDCAAVLANCASPDPAGPCDPGAVAVCAARYGNTPQEDTFGIAGTGDQCETGIRTAVQPMFDGTTEPPEGGVCTFYGDTYRVSLDLVGGDVVADSAGQVHHVSDSRTGVEVGACACLAASDADGWDIDCAANDCRFNSEQNRNLEKAWNPIQAPEIGRRAGLPGQHSEPIYPVFCPDGSTTCDVEHLSADLFKLVYGRQMPFSRNPGRGAVDLTWDYKNALQFPYLVEAGAAPRPYEWQASGPHVTTRIRAAWPNHGFDYDDAFYSTFVSFTDPIKIQRHWYDGCIPEFRAYDPWWWIRNPVPVPDVFRWDERVQTVRPLSGLLFGHVPELGRTALYGLGRESLAVERAWEIDSPVALEDSLQASAAAYLPGDLFGQQDTESVLALAVYTRATISASRGAGRVVALGDEQVFDSHLLLGAPGPDAAVAFVDTASIAGQPAPFVHEAKVVVLPRRRQVLLVGHPMGAAVPVAYRLDLETGEWRGPRELSGLGERAGFALAHDPARDRILVFGGLQGGVASAEVALGDVVALDPDSLVGRPLAIEAPEGLARGRAGVYLDPISQELFVMGGQRGGELLADGYVIDLRRGAAAPLPADGDATGALEPFVYRQRRAGRIFVADLEGKSAAEGLLLLARERDGAWSLTRTSIGTRPATFPVQTTVLPGRSAVYYLRAPDAADLPGQLTLATVTSEAGALALQAQSGAAELLAAGWPEGADASQAAFLCAPGATCRLALRPGGEALGRALPFTLDAGEATLQPVEDLFVMTPVQDLTMSGGSVIIATPPGIGVLDGASRQWRTGLTGPGVAAGQALTACGRYLCLARLGSHGLTVLDLADPDHPVIRQEVITAGPGWDAAAAGRQVFVAHGVVGVGVYDISATGELGFQDTLVPGGFVQSVAASRGLLAAAEPGGRIHLYRLEGGLTKAGDLQASGKVSRVRFVAGRLWVLSKKEDRFEVFDVSDPGSPVRIGKVREGAAEAFRRRFGGPFGFTYSGNLVRVQRAVRVSP